MGEHFCLKWNNHQENLTGIMTKLLDEQKFVDVSLVCEMKTFKAHQTVLSACSPYFEQVLEENPHPHPIIILRDVKECEMSALLQYMYRGEVNVRDDELSTFLHTARALQVRGLSDNKKELREEAPTSTPSSASTTIAQSVTVNATKRRRISTSAPEPGGSDRLHLDCQPSIPSACKSSPKVNSSSNAALGPISSVSNYSDNSSDVHYADTSGAPPSIKQEMEPAAVVADEPYTLPHHMSSNAEQRSTSDWAMDYHHSYDPPRHYPPLQKVELPKVPNPMTHNFSSQMQATPPLPALYPCIKNTKTKKDEPKLVKLDTPGTSYAQNQPVSVIRNTEFTNEIHIQTSGLQRKGGRFRPGWMENYSWLQYDEGLNTMFCKTCRKWSSTVPDIRTSFVEGNGNFRLEIVNHHDKSKAHRLCMAKEEESIPRLEPIGDDARHGN